MSRVARGHRDRHWDVPRWQHRDRPAEDEATRL